MSIHLRVQASTTPQTLWRSAEVFKLEQPPRFNKVEEVQEASRFDEVWLNMSTYIIESLVPPSVPRGLNINSVFEKVRT